MYSDSDEKKALMKETVTPERLFVLAAVIFLAEAVVAVLLYTQQPIPSNTPERFSSGDLQIVVPTPENASQITLTPETTAEELRKFMNADGSFNPEMIRAYAESSVPAKN